MQEKQTFFDLGRIQSTGDWFWYGLLLAMLIAGVAWTYRRDTPGRPLWVRGVLISLRSAVLLVLFGIFLDPQLRTETTVHRPSRVLFLADSSLSMSLADIRDAKTGERVSREERIAGLLGNQALIDRFRDNNEVAIYGFGRNLEEIKRFARRGAVYSAGTKAIEDDGTWRTKFKAVQDQSKIPDSIVQVLREESEAPVAAVIVVSDGRATEGSNLETAIEAAKRQEVPIHSAVVGADSGHRNLRISDLVMPTRAFPGDEVKITANISGTGIEPDKSIPVTVTIEDTTNTKPARQIYNATLKLAKDRQAQPIEVRYLPDAVGNWRIRVSTAFLDDEVRNDDNMALGGLEVIDRKTKVLLMASGPSREYQFLRNLLHRDKSIELSVLLQSAIDDPISQDADHVLAGFPSSREELLNQDVLLALDPDWSEIEAPQRELLVDWLAEQAGGAVLVAGPIYTPRLARDETLDEIQQFYPVDLKAIFTSDLQPGSENEPWPIRLTPEGESAELLSLDDDPAKSRRLWEEFRGFYWCYPVDSIKPGASVLAQFSDPRAAVGGLPPPVFVSQFFGAGRVFYLGSGEMWRIRRLGEKYYERWWIRLVRHLAQGRLLRGTGRGALILDADRFLLGTTVSIHATALDPEFRPLATESLTLAVELPSGTTKEVTLKAEREQPGRFLGQLAASEPGEHRLRLLIPDSTEVIERRILVTVPDIEFDDPRADPSYLQKLAAATGGSSVSVDEIESLAAKIEDRTEVTVFSGIPVALWDRGWVIVIVVTLLGAEWLLRKIYSLS